MDHASGLRRGRTDAYRPGAHLRLSRSEVSLEAEQFVGAANDAIQPGLLEFELREELHAIGFIELRNFGFN